MTPRPVKKINGTLASSLGRTARRTHRAAVHTSKKTTIPLNILKEASCAAIQASSEAMVALDRMPKVGFGLDCPASICEANIFRSPATTRKAMLNMAVLKAAPKSYPFVVASLIRWVSVTQPVWSGTSQRPEPRLLPGPAAAQAQLTGGPGKGLVARPRPRP